MAKSNSSAASASKSEKASQVPSGDTKRKKVSDENDDDRLSDDKDVQELWDIACVLAPNSEKLCRTDECNAIAVATWATNTDPEDKWDMCEKCQEKDFGGWPEGFHPKDRKDTQASEGPNDNEVKSDDVDQRSQEESPNVINDKEGEREPVTVEDSSVDDTQASLGKDETAKDIKALLRREKGADESHDSDCPSHEDSPIDARECESNAQDPQRSDSEEEMWDLKRVLSVKDLSRDCPIKCSTEDCLLAACSVWVSSHAPRDKWYSCIDCQESDFEGWPVLEDLPIKHLSEEHKSMLSNKCSSQRSPSFPNLPCRSEASPASTKDSSHAFTPPRPSVNSKLTQEQLKEKGATVTPSPANRRTTQQSKNLLKAHRKWQEQAETMGGPDARIVVNKVVAKKLIFDVLHDSFCPMNITQLHTKLKAVIPSPILKSCLDEMSLDSADDGNQFADSDSEEDEAKKSKKKAKDTSNVPYSGSLAFKAGRNANTCLYFVDHTKLKNQGNGLDAEERNELAAGIAAVEAEEVSLNESLKQAIGETNKLLKEPTNEEATASLEIEEAETKDVSEKVEEARKLQVNEKHKVQTKKRIDSMAGQWRKRKRLCMDFLIQMEESTDGVVSMKKCLSGDGQIDLDSDEAVIKSATATVMKKRAKPGSGAKSSQGKLGARGKKRSLTQKEAPAGVSSDDAFVAVRLDPTGSVSRVYLEGEEPAPTVKRKRKLQIAHC